MGIILRQLKLAGDMQPGQQLVEPSQDRRQRAHVAAVEKEPTEPGKAAENDVALVEQVDDMAIPVGERTKIAIRIECLDTSRMVVANQAANKAGHVGQRRVDPHCAKVDEARDPIACEEEMVVMDVANRRLQGEVQPTGGLQRRDKRLQTVASEREDRCGSLVEFSV
jgi:hypothetical protein